MTEVVVPVQAFLPRARGLIFDGECFGGETQCRSRRSRKSVPLRLPPAPVTSHVEPVLLQYNVLRVVCGFVFLSKAFVCVSETVRDQSTKYSPWKREIHISKAQQTKLKLLSAVRRKHVCTTTYNRTQEDCCC